MRRNRPAIADFASFSKNFDHVLPIGWPLQREQFAPKGMGDIITQVRQSSVGRWLEAEREFVRAEETLRRTDFYISSSKVNRVFALARFMIDVGCALYVDQVGTRSAVKTELLRKSQRAAWALIHAIKRGVGYASPAMTNDLYWRLRSFHETCKAYLGGEIPRIAPGREDKTLRLRLLAVELAQRFHHSFHSCMPQVVQRVLEIDSPGCVSEKMVREVCRNIKNAATYTPGFIHLREGQPLKRVRK